MERGFWRKAVWFFSLLVGFPALAQLNRGTITGAVTDPSGAAIAEAKITAVHLDTNTSSSTTSTASGNYTLSALQIGVYRLEVEAPGFKRAKRDTIPVTAGTTIGIDVALEIGSVAESVEVQALAAPIETESTRVGTNITNQLVQDLPLVVAGRIRNVFNLAVIAP